MDPNEKQANKGSKNESGHLAPELATAAAITSAASFSAKVTKEVKYIQKFKLNEVKCDSECKICAI